MATAPELVQSFNERFGDSEEPLWTLLGEIRWPEGVICPVCRYGVRLSTRGRYVCTACGRHDRVTKGTPFYRKRLRDWLLAGWLMVGLPRSVTKNDLLEAVQLGNRGTAAKMARLYRNAMAALAPQDLVDKVNWDSIRQHGFWQSYQPDPERDERDDVTAWVKAGFPHGYGLRTTMDHNCRVGIMPDQLPIVLSPYIGELVFRYAYRAESDDKKYRRVIAHVVGGAVASPPGGQAL